MRAVVVALLSSAVAVVVRQAARRRHLPVRLYSTQHLVGLGPLPLLRALSKLSLLFLEPSLCLYAHRFGAEPLSGWHLVQGWVQALDVPAIVASCGAGPVPQTPSSVALGGLTTLNTSSEIGIHHLL